MRIVVILLLLCGQAVVGTQRKHTAFLSQLQNTDVQLTFQQGEQESGTGGSDGDYFFEGNERNGERLRRYMTRDDGDFLLTYGDTDELLVPIDLDE